MPSELDEPAVKTASLGIATEPRFSTSVPRLSDVEVLGNIDAADEPWTHQPPTIAIAAAPARQLQGWTTMAAPPPSENRPTMESNGRRSSLR